MTGTTVLDASVLIAALEPSDAHHRRAVALMTSLGPQTMTVHPLTLAEVLVGAVRKNVGAKAQAAVGAAGVTTQPGDVVAPVAIATTRADSGLRIPDAIVLATAQALGADLATFDTVLADRATKAGVDVTNTQQQT
ncbi:MAG: PIN domain-containing protein [Micrococcales bacterium]|nr:PIN domain-containing protein [Micrococcales bacterium]MCL2666593.1 PIN domain-containing protein [Micrococcales bacterium]